MSKEGVRVPREVKVAVEAAIEFGAEPIVLELEEVDHGLPTSKSREDFEGINPTDIVKIYLDEASKTPLLTKQEEVLLAGKVKKGLKAEQVFKKNGLSLSKKKRAKLTEEENSGLEAINQFITANTRLVTSIAKKFIGRGLDFPDLIQEGNLGIRRAAKKFDPDLGFRFSTYATWWVRQAIIREIANQSRTVRVPVHRLDKIRKLYKAQRLQTQLLGREPRVDELAKALDMPQKEVNDLLEASLFTVSLATPVGDEEDSELGDFLADESAESPEDEVHKTLLREKIDGILEKLPLREAKVLRLRFGLDAIDGKGLTLEEVGGKYGLTRERVRQIETRALGRIKYGESSRSQLLGSVGKDVLVKNSEPSYLSYFRHINPKRKFISVVKAVGRLKPDLTLPQVRQALNFVPGEYREMLELILGFNQEQKAYSIAELMSRFSYDRGKMDYKVEQAAILFSEIAQHLGFVKSKDSS